MFQCPRQRSFEMETSMNNCIIYYSSSSNSNTTGNWDSRCSNDRHIESCSNNAEFLTSSQRRGQVINNNHTGHFYQGYKSMKDLEYSSCVNLLDNIKKNRARYTRPRMQQLVTKRKRRTVFNTEQILTLEKIFNRKPYVSREERQELKERLNVSDRVIKVWFQNRRRMSGQKETVMSMYTDSSEEEIERNFNLDYVQSRIDKPDQFGYVTLDDRAMKQLMTAVDSILTDVDVDLDCMEVINKPSSNVLNYEPISPVSVHDDDDDVACLSEWEPHAPEDSLRRLFDVQSLMSHQLS